MLLLNAGIATSVVQGQSLSSLRIKKVVVEAAGQLVDTLSIAPGSLNIYGSRNELTKKFEQPVAAHYYQISGRYLQWTAFPKVDSVWLVYRVLPFDLLASKRLLDTTQFRRNADGQLIGTYDPYIRGDIFESNGGVNYNGSFSRGISFGNRQNLVLNSAFNLQMEGKLGNGVLVKAAITDESLPIQAAGNTQQLREFDKVFIQLKKGQSSLIAGDYELRNPQGYFMRYFKKLEGATFKTRQGDINSEDGSYWEHSGSIAIARGQFIRQSIQAIESNQGPYKLSGNGNQRFLIILSGTERIYLDGRLLRRGQDADYVIDYNLAELIFTSRQLITKDSRIVAEYEYADQRYVRSLYAANSKYESAKFTAYVNLISQQDSKTASGDLSLSDTQKQQLSLAGDSDSGVFISGIDSLEGRADQRATYQLIDTLIMCGDEVQENFILSYTTTSEAPLYTASFSDLGPNGGPYELAPLSTANERSYRFVGYDENCTPLGRYAPIINLSTPEKRQLLTVGGQYRSKHGKLGFELGRSLLDKNRFSQLDSNDDIGYGMRLDGSQIIALGRGDSSWQLVAEVAYEARAQNFQPPNPYRSTDFFRNWNLSNRLGIDRPEDSEERLFSSSLQLKKASIGLLKYEFGRFRRGATYSGDRQLALLELKKKGWKVSGNASYLSNKKESSNGTFWQSKIEIGKQLSALGNWQISGTYNTEHSEQRALQTDTLLPISFGYEQFSFGLSSMNESAGSFSFKAQRRRDVLPDGSAQLATATIADEVSIEGTSSDSKNLQLGGNFTYRNLSVRNRTIIDQSPTQTFLGRLDLKINGIKNSLRSQTSYTLGSGQEARVEFQYLFVGAGLGQYIWQDSLYNNDGRIQANEMAIAPFQDLGDYVRVSAFTDDFIRTNNATVNQSISWNFDRLWEKPKNWQRFIKRFDLQSSLTINRKTRDAQEVQVWNPLQLNINDTTLVSLSAGTRHNIFFNRRNPKYDIQISNRDLRRRQVLTTGYEASRQREWSGRLSYRPYPKLNLIIKSSIGARIADSEFFNNKDYDIHFRWLEPEVDWQPGKHFRFKGKLIVGRERNELISGNGESSNRLEINLNGNYKRWIDASLRSVNIELVGDANSPVGFALLNGLQAGRNWLWNINFTKQLGQYLQLNIAYNGRQTGVSKTVHVGRAQVTALF